MTDVRPASLRHRFSRALALGVLWGAAVGAMEAVVLPVLDGSSSSFVVLLVSNMGAWAIVGMGIAWAVEYTQRWREQPISNAVSIVVGVLAFSAFASLLFAVESVPGPGLGVARVFPSGADPLASLLYQAWILLFYGGLYVVAWTLNQRAERTRALLTETQIARIRSETLLAEAQLQALRGYVDPQFLLRVTREIQHRYDAAAEDANRLVDLLVGFLRAAMPGLRSGCSTLAAELTLARSYSDLWADLGSQRPSCAIDGPEPFPDVPFPPLLLLSVLDRLAFSTTGQERARLRVIGAEGDVSLSVDAPGISGSDWLTPELAFRIRVDLATLFGREWSMSFRNRADGAEPALTMTMRTMSRIGDSSCSRHRPLRLRKEVWHDD